MAELRVWDGRIYAGYGDYNANTGPIAVASFDPAVGTFATEFVSDTEAILTIRPIAGHLYAPSTDPRATADFAVSGPWTDRQPVGATHVFDMTTLTDTDLWMVGSRGNDAVAWRSLDGGQTWIDSLVVPPRVAGEFSRFYFAGVLAGRLYVNAVDSGYGPLPTSKVFDGMSWTDGPGLLPNGGFGWQAQTVNGTMLFHSVGHGASGSLMAFDGATVSVVGSGYDFEVTGDTVYLLGNDGRVSSSTDLRRWTRLASGPGNARSIAVLDGTVYLGTTDSQLWAYPMGSASPVDGGIAAKPGRTKS